MRIGLLTAGHESQFAKRGDLYEVICVADRADDPDTAQLFLDAGVDYVFAPRYPWVLSDAMLDAFPKRIIILHNGDLTDRRRWIGPEPVLDALLAGVTATRTSLYFATREIGHGPIFLVGPRHAVPQMVQDALARGDYDSVATYALLHSRWMRRSWPDLMLRAIECLSVGTVKIVRDTVWVDGVPGPCRLGEAPDFCDDRVHGGIPASCPFIQI